VAGAGIRLVQSAVGVCKPSTEMDRTERRLSGIKHCASPRPYIKEVLVSREASPFAIIMHTAAAVLNSRSGRERLPS